MKSKSLFIGIILSLSLGIPVVAQVETSWYQEAEYFFGIGTTNYFGDVGGRDSKIIGPQAFFDHLDLDLWQTRAMICGGARVTPWKQISFSGQVAPIWLSGNDLRSNYAYRGYKFNTTILEFSGQVEYYFANRMTGLAPYAFAGFGGMIYRFTNNKPDAKPKWNTTNGLLVGMGARLPGGKKITHSLDFAGRFTTTDFLDGFHTDFNTTDIYLTVSYKINFAFFTLWTYDHRGRVK